MGNLNLWLKSLAMGFVMFGVALAGDVLMAPYAASIRLGATRVGVPTLSCGLTLMNFLNAALVGLFVTALFFIRNRNLFQRTLVNAAIHHEVNSAFMVLSLAQTESQRVAAARQIAIALEKHCPVTGMKIKSAMEYIRKNR
jgi:hypothetical protein